MRRRGQVRYKFYREHKYVSFALNDLERLIAKTDFRDSLEVERIKQEFQAVLQMLKGHAHYENNALHELLRKKGSKVYEHVEQDHKHYDMLLEDLQNKLNGVLESTLEEELLELGYQFYLAFRKFVGENLIHLHEEETIILPELQRLYSDEELRLVEFDTYRRMTVEQMIHMLEVLFPHMNASDREFFLGEIKDSEPEKFSQVWLGIEPKLPSKEREYLAEKLLLEKTK